MRPAIIGVVSVNSAAPAHAAPITGAAAVSSGKSSSYRVHRGGQNSSQPRAVTDKWPGEMCCWKVISTHVTVALSGELPRNATEGHRDGACTSGSCWDYFTDTSLAEKAFA